MTPITFAANLKWLFTEQPLKKRFDAAAAAGFTGVEVPDPYSMSPGEFATRINDAGVAAVLINTPAGLAGSPTQFGAACLPEHVAEFRIAVQRGLEYAAAAACPILHVVGGRLPKDASIQRGFATYVDNIAWAAQQARGTATSIVLEMQNQRSAPGFILRSQDEAAIVVETVGEPVGILFDFFHTQVAEGDVTTAFSRHLPLVKHIQIGDGPSRTEPGTGEVSWPFVFEVIRNSEYDGWVGCEFTPDGVSDGVVERLRRLI